VAEERRAWHGLRVPVGDARTDERDRGLQEPAPLQRGRIPRQDSSGHAQLAHGTRTQTFLIIAVVSSGPGRPVGPGPSSSNLTFRVPNDSAKFYQNLMKMRPWERTQIHRVTSQFDLTFVEPIR